MKISANDFIKLHNAIRIQAIQNEPALENAQNNRLYGYQKGNSMEKKSICGQLQSVKDCTNDLEFKNDSEISGKILYDCYRQAINGKEVSISDAYLQLYCCFVSKECQQNPTDWKDYLNKIIGKDIGNVGQISTVGTIEIEEFKKTIKILHNEKEVLNKKIKKYNWFAIGLCVGLCIALFFMNTYSMRYESLKEWATMPISVDSTNTNEERTAYNEFTQHFRSLENKLNEYESDISGDLTHIDTTRSLPFDYKNINDTSVKFSLEFEKYQYSLNSGMTMISPYDARLKKSLDHWLIFNGMNTSLSKDASKSKNKDNLKKILNDILGWTNDKYSPILIYSLIIPQKDSAAFMYRFPRYKAIGGKPFSALDGYDYKSRPFFQDIQAKRTIYLNKDSIFGITPMYADYKRGLQVRTVWYKIELKGEKKTKIADCYIFIDFVVNN